jgi:hypothetical protein
MNPDKNHLNARTKIIVLAVVIIAAAGLFGWLIGRNSSSNSGQTSTSPQTTSSRAVEGSNVKSLVSYTLPDGWLEGTVQHQVAQYTLAPTAPR